MVLLVRAGASRARGLGRPAAPHGVATGRAALQPRTRRVGTV